MNLVAEVQALRQRGLKQREIAVRIGISRSRVCELLTDPDGTKARIRRDRYRGTCEDCGGPTDGSNGRARAPSVCAKCEAQRRRDGRMWTRDTIVAAIQAWASEHGRPPRASDWMRAAPGRPVSATVYSHGAYVAPFASWADAIEAAGFTRPEVGRYAPLERVFTCEVCGTTFAKTVRGRYLPLCEECRHGRVTTTFRRCKCDRCRTALASERA